MDYTRIQIESIGIGLANINNLDLTKDNFIRNGKLYYLSEKGLEKLKDLPKFNTI